MSAAHKTSNYCADDQFEKVKPTMLAKLEKDLQECIQELLGMNQSAHRLKEKEELQKDITNNLSLLRTKMRTLRRWRNGTEACCAEEVSQLSTFIGKAHIRIYEAKITQLLSQLNHVDELLDTQQEVDEIIVRHRQDVDCLLPVLQERLKSVDFETETVQCVSGFKEDLQEIQTLVLSL